MKKVISMLLVFAFLFAAVPYAWAEESSSVSLDDNELYQEALVVFPEFADELTEAYLHPSLPQVNTRSAVNNFFTEDNLLYKETRSTEDGTLTLLQFPGNVYSLIGQKTWQQTGGGTGSGYSSYTGNLMVTFTGAIDQLYVNGFSYILVQGAYDSITSYGNAYNSYTAASCNTGNARANELAGSPAYAIYNTNLHSAIRDTYGDFIPLPLACKITVGNDSCLVYMNDIRV